MVNYRISQIDSISSGSAVYLINQSTNPIIYSDSQVTGSSDNRPVPTPAIGSSGNTLDRVWGIMKETDIANGNVMLTGGGSFNTSAMIKGQIYPCYLKSIQVSSGSFGLLS